jgi:hypothetical protein
MLTDVLICELCVMEENETCIPFTLKVKDGEDLFTCLSYMRKV